MPVVIVRAVTIKDAATLARDLNNPNMDAKALMRNLTKFLDDISSGNVPGGPSVSITVIDEKTIVDHISIGVKNVAPGDELTVNGKTFKAALPEEGQLKPKDGEFFVVQGSDGLSQAIIDAFGEELVVNPNGNSISLKLKADEGEEPSGKLSLEANGSGGIVVAGAGFQAVGHITFNPPCGKGDSFSVGGKTFTGVTLDTPGDSDYQVSPDPNMTASAAAHAINEVSDEVFATALGNVVLLRARKAGEAGNDIALEVQEGSIEVSGPKLISGSEPSVVDFKPGHHAPVSVTF